MQIQLSQRGFTLVELMFVIVIGMIIVSFGAPAFMGLVKNNSITANVNDIVTAIQITRSEASKRGLAVTLCPSDNSNVDGASCASDEWELGYIAFVDTNADGSRDANEELVLARGPFNKNVFVKANDSIQGGITYGGDGFPVGLAGMDTTLVFCDDPDDDSRIRVLDISSTGRPLVLRDASPPAGLSCSG